MSRNERTVLIAGTGSCLPERTMTNHDMEKIVETSDEWIVTRTGIKERRIIEKNMPSVYLAKVAAEKALADAGLKAEDIDLIIAATITSDMATPSTACMVQAEIGASKAAAFDINAACSGFIYGINTAFQFIKTGHYNNALVVGVDALSRLTDWTDRNTCVLFGDGAGAAVLKAGNEGEEGILSTYIGADGTLGVNLTCPQYFVSEQEKEKRKGRDPKTIWMDGSEVFKFAVRILEKATREAIYRAGIKEEEVSLLIPHQANMRIVEGAAKRLEYNPEKIYTNLDKYGNMSAASIPVALDDAVREGRLKKDDIIVMVGFGGGLTWGSAAVKWTK